MKQANDRPLNTPASDAEKPPLPHETDQSADSQQEAHTRDIGRQAHEDIERGLVDTDRRSAEPGGVPDGENKSKP